MAALSSGQVVSLDSKDTMDDISVSTAEGDFPVTVVRDAYNDRQWYYIPPRPRLVERTTDGETRPVFSMYRYQLPDSAHPGQLIDGGILQFSVTYALKADDIDKVKGIVAQRRGVPASQISLTALRPKSAEVTVYTPGENGTFVTSVNGGGKAPLFATQEMPFTIELNKLGASVYQQIESGQGGVKIGITFKYPGLTPPAGFKVTADYKQLHDYYEHNSHFRAEASYFGFFGASYESTSQQIRSELVNSGGLHIDITPGSGLTLEDIDRYLQPILKRINDNIIELFKPPTEVPANAPWNPRTGSFGGINYSVSTKDVHQIRQQTETIDFSFRQYEERETTAGAFISVGSYSENIRKKLFITLSPDINPVLYMILPQLDDQVSSGNIRAATIDLSIMKPGQDAPLRTVSGNWKPTYGTDWNIFEALAGEYRAPQIQVPLADLRQAGYDLGTLKVRSTLKLVSALQGDAPLEIVQEFPVAEATTKVMTPGVNYQLVSVDPSNLTWRMLNPSAPGKQVAQVQLKITCGSRSITQTLSPRNVNGNVTPPTAFGWFVPKRSIEANAVKLEVQFLLSDGSKVAWSGNGDIREKYLDLNVPLFDTDWKGV